MNRRQEIEERLAWWEYHSKHATGETRSAPMVDEVELLRMELRAVRAEEEYLTKGRQLDEALDTIAAVKFLVSQHECYPSCDGVCEKSQTS